MQTHNIQPEQCEIGTGACIKLEILATWNIYKKNPAILELWGPLTLDFCHIISRKSDKYSHLLSYFGSPLLKFWCALSSSCSPPLGFCLRDHFCPLQAYQRTDSERQINYCQWSGGRQEFIFSVSKLHRSFIHGGKETNTTGDYIFCIWERRTVGHRKRLRDDRKNGLSVCKWKKKAFF